MLARGDADDLRLDHIVTQLEESEQRRLAEARDISSPREEFLTEQLNQYLSPHKLDGTEAHLVIDQLAATALDAGAGEAQISAATRQAKVQMQTLLFGLVPVEEVMNFFARFMRDWR